LGVAQTLFSALAQDYVTSHRLGGNWPVGRMVALVGDPEMDEGNIYEALLEGWKHGLRNCWWVIDHNRQSLDGIIREGLWQKFEDRGRWRKQARRCEAVRLKTCWLNQFQQPTAPRERPHHRRRR
jgi:pyruvate dehydrogenase complex dehydrogenase (E1) component